MTNAEKSRLPKKKGDTSNTAKKRHKSGQDKGKTNKKTKISFVWKDRGRKLIVVSEVAAAATGLPPTSKIQATPACLVANNTTAPLKICTSGWRPTPGSGLNLNGERWTHFVRELCAVIKFPLKISIRDTPQSAERVTENDGRYDACHAEKKLGLYFFAKQMQFCNMKLRDALAGQLRNAGLSDRRMGAKIYLGHKPCRSCRDFLRCIKHLSGISIKAVSCPVFAEHTRTRVFFNGQPTLTGAFGGGGGGTPGQNNHLKKLLGDGNESSDDEDEDGDVDGDNVVKTTKSKKNGESGRDEEDEYEGGDDDEIVMSGDIDSPDPLEAAEEIIAGLPVGNVTRPVSPRPPCLSPRSRPVAIPLVHRQPLIVQEQQPEEDADSECGSPEPSVPDVQVPAPPTNSSSVRSSPSPSMSMASVMDASSVMDPRDRFPVYTSPSRRGGSAAPPSIWGARHKPPTTPCLEPPNFGASQGQTTGDTNNNGVSSSWVAANEVSFFFGTPSAPSLLSDYAGPVEMSGATARRTLEHQGTPEAPILVPETPVSPSLRVVEQPLTMNPMDLQLQPRPAPPARTRLEILSDAAYAVSTGSVQELAVQDLTSSQAQEQVVVEQAAVEQTVQPAVEESPAVSSAISVVSSSVVTSVENFNNDMPAYLRQMARNANANSFGNGAATTNSISRTRQTDHGANGTMDPNHRYSQFAGQANIVIHAPAPRSGGRSPVLPQPSTFGVPVVNLTGDIDDRSDTASRLPFVRGEVENPWDPRTTARTPPAPLRSQAPVRRTAQLRPARTQSNTAQENRTPEENQEPDLMVVASRTRPVRPTLTRGVAYIPPHFAATPNGSNSFSSPPQAISSQQ